MECQAGSMPAARGRAPVAIMVPRSFNTEVAAAAGAYGNGADGSNNQAPEEEVGEYGVLGLSHGHAGVFGEGEGREVMGYAEGATSWADASSNGMAADGMIIEHHSPFAGSGMFADNGSFDIGGTGAGRVFNFGDEGTYGFGGAATGGVFDIGGARDAGTFDIGGAPAGGVFDAVGARNNGAFDLGAAADHEFFTAEDAAGNTAVANGEGGQWGLQLQPVNGGQYGGMTDQLWRQVNGDAGDARTHIPTNWLERIMLHEALKPTKAHFFLIHGIRAPQTNIFHCYLAQWWQIHCASMALGTIDNPAPHLVSIGRFDGSIACWVTGAVHNKQAVDWIALFGQAFPGFLPINLWWFPPDFPIKYLMKDQAARDRVSDRSKGNFEDGFYTLTQLYR